MEIIVALIFLAFIFWYTRNREKKKLVAGSPRWNVEVPSSETLTGWEKQLDIWVAQQRLAPELAQQIRSLIQQDRTAFGQLSAAPPSLPLLPNAQGQIPAKPAHPNAAPARRRARSYPVGGASARTSPASPLPARASTTARLWEAVLALRTRQTLLFLGAFLLVVSALILVVFNWASFPPLLQLALLTGVCGSFWAGGAWMTRRPGLEQAGIGLQAVGGVLVPVVAFAVTRPGLLALAPRPSWFLASALSVPIYILAAWRLRHGLFAVAGCLAFASAVVAGLGFVPDQALPLPLVGVLISYLPLARWLKNRAPSLAPGVHWVAHLGLPLTLLGAWVILLDAGTGAATFAWTLWAGTLFYAIALLPERETVGTSATPYAAWSLAALVPLALLATLSAAAAGEHWRGLAFAGMALMYLLLGGLLEIRARRYSLPAYAGVPLLGLMALAWAASSLAAAQWTLPVLLLLVLLTVTATHRGRFAALAPSGRGALATGALAGAGLLLPIWIVALLLDTMLDPVWYGVVTLPVAALYFVGAYAWPGRLRMSYDLVLQALAVLLAVVSAPPTLLNEESAVGGMVLLTATWTLQALLRRRTVWAILALGSGLVAAVVSIDRFLVDLMTVPVWLNLGLLVTVVYTLGGTLVRRGAWRYWSWSALGWGALAGSLTLALVVVDLADAVLISEGVRTQHVLVVALLAGLVALLQRLWQQPLLGYAAAPLGAAALLLLTGRGFFTAWRPTLDAFGYTLCGWTLSMAVLGQGLRRRARSGTAPQRHALPYEIVGYVLLVFAPLLTTGVGHATLIWTAVALLYGLAARLYRLPWLLTLVLLAVDMALLSGAGWLRPGGRPADAGRLLLVAAAVQAVIGLALRRRTPVQRAWTRPAYAAALVSSVAALGLASTAPDALAVVALGLAVLLALLASLEQREEGAWAALGLLALGLASIHMAREIDPQWSAALGMIEAFGVALLGFLVERAPRSAIWRKPLVYGPLAAGSLLLIVLFERTQWSDTLVPLTLGLATFALILATTAVRLRQVAFVYGVGAAVVAAFCSQLADWGLREPQWYVIPAGLYLLAVAHGLRRFQNWPGPSQLVEAGALTLLLGTTLAQSVRADGVNEAQSLVYAAWLCAEALLVLGYGVLSKLRVPFLGGGGFFILGVLWLSVDPLRAANKWMLLGALGLVLVGVYVLLERRQEQLARAGRAWAERVGSWQ